ncbi:MAG: SDR family oxidoreductase [Opitutales bacterium]|nr:SDR family oxidoreductase [Opitutales bacterium]MCH8541255.1 SDR family oxidoreductase [Opitutales bacterium]
MKILVTGATGYIGGRLIPLLIENGHKVTVFVRNPDRIAGRWWLPQVEIITGDILDPPSEKNAFGEFEAAYFLIHGMGGKGSFAERDRRAAENFMQRAANIKKIIYLGGILPQSPQGRTSRHLDSRAEVGNILRQTGKTTEFRAGPIIGSGSSSFEMVRYLTERLPAMIAPKWIKNQVQTIAVRDILAYLIAALDKPPLDIVEVGAPPVTFLQMMKGYAAARNLRRIILPVPVLAPKLAALWVGFVTPIPNRLAVPLVEGVVYPVVGNNEKARKLFPKIIPTSYETAVRRAVQKVQSRSVETRWSGALGQDKTFALTDWEGLIKETRSRLIQASPESTFAALTRLGGDQGWLVWKWAWWIRGILDQLVGGPGLRRGRRDPDNLYPGEALDFWRVEKIVPNQQLLLRAEMKVPGKAWLRFEILPEENGVRLIQTALFQPHGFSGFLYWYSLYPLHKFIFSDLINAIIKEAQHPPKQ